MLYLTLSPPERAPPMALKVASTDLPASAFDISALEATESTNWALFTFISSNLIKLSLKSQAGSGD